MARLDSRFRITTDPHSLLMSVDLVDKAGRVLMRGALTYSTRAQLERGCQQLREHLEGAILTLPSHEGEPLRLKHHRPRATKATKAAQAAKQRKKK